MPVSGHVQFASLQLTRRVSVLRVHADDFWDPENLLSLMRRLKYMPRYRNGSSSFFKWRVVVDDAPLSAYPESGAVIACTDDEYGLVFKESLLDVASDARVEEVSKLDMVGLEDMPGATDAGYEA